MNKKVIIGESVISMTHIFPMPKTVSLSRQVNIVYTGDLVIPSKSVLQITGIRNGFVFLHEHEVQEADWSVLKRLFLEVVDSSDRRVIGQRLEMTGVAVRSCLSFLPEDLQGTSYRWSMLKKKRGMLKSPIRHTVAD